MTLAVTLFAGVADEALVIIGSRYEGRLQTLLRRTVGLAHDITVVGIGSGIHDHRAVQRHDIGDTVASISGV